MAETSTAALDKKSDKYRAQLDAALKDDEDPLAAYGQFIKWTIDHYPGDLIAQSGLLELLEEATRQFKSDPQYKGDLRYLKLWSLYASYVETPTTIYKFLLANDIGTVYAQLYEEYASALEKGGRCVISASFSYRTFIHVVTSIDVLMQRRYSSTESNVGPDQSSDSRKTMLNFNLARPTLFPVRGRTRYHGKMYRLPYMPFARTLSRIILNQPSQHPLPQKLLVPTPSRHPRHRRHQCRI